MKDFELIRKSMEEDFKISISSIEPCFDRYHIKFRINAESEGFVPDACGLGMAIQCIMPDGEVQAEISMELAYQRYDIPQPEFYEERIRRIVDTAFKGMGVKLEKIVQPDPEKAFWELKLTYPEGTVFSNEPYFVIKSCSAREVLVELDLSTLKEFESNYEID